MSILKVDTIAPYSNDNVSSSGSLTVTGSFEVTGNSSLTGSFDVLGDSTFTGNYTLTNVSGAIITPTQSATPTFDGVDGQFVFGTDGGNHFIYVWMSGAWHSGSLV